MWKKGRGLARGLVLAAFALATGAIGTPARAQTDGGAAAGGAVDGGVTDGGPQGTILDFHTLAPVSGQLVGSANPIRGVNGGAFPWTIGHGDGTLRADGELEVNVSGLVLASDPAVPQNQQGTNPSPTFTVIVSCMTTGATGAPQQMNVSTPAAAATPAGTAQIHAKVALPNPCFAPVLFVAGANGAWFASTGSPPEAAIGTDGGPDAGPADAGTADGGR